MNSVIHLDKKMKEIEKTVSRISFVQFDYPQITALSSKNSCQYYSCVCKCTASVFIVDEIVVNRKFKTGFHLKFGNKSQSKQSQFTFKFHFVTSVLMKFLMSGGVVVKWLMKRESEKTKYQPQWWYWNFDNENEFYSNTANNLQILSCNSV